jgi:hypothetical protein
MRRLLLTSAPQGSTIRNRGQRLVALLLGGLLLTLAATSSAQNTGEQPWYQIEVIVFKRQQETYQEHWPTNITLAYPSRWKVLEDPEAIAEVLYDEDALGDIIPALDDSAPTDSDTDTALVPVAATAEIDRLANTPFLLLPTAEHALAARAAALRRNARYQLVFHQAWRQPALPPRTASAVVINGGEQFDKHRELEGSISVSFSQFLQVKANLWLTQFAPINEQSTDDWPALPPIPQVEPSSTVSRVWTEPVLLPGQSDLDTGYAEDEFLNQAPAEEDLIDRYQPARIVLLQEERRIRARELHYLDHPLFGVILLVTPYQIPVAGE